MGTAVERLQADLAGQYTLERELGRGGTATVYLAHDQKHERPVAVKVLRPDVAAALGAERFLREIHIAARLTHPHILSLHDSGKAAGFLYYVMPYVAGDSLRERLRRDGQLPLEDALTIAREVADALSLRPRRGHRAPRHQAGEHSLRRRPRGRGRLRDRRRSRRSQARSAPADPPG